MESDEKKIRPGRVGLDRSTLLGDRLQGHAGQRYSQKHKRSWVQNREGIPALEARLASFLHSLSLKVMFASSAVCDKCRLGDVESGDRLGFHNLQPDRVH